MSEPYRPPLNEREYTELLGLYGIPYRRYSGESVPVFRDGDPYYRRPHLAFEGHVRVFDMSKEEDVLEWDRVVRLCSERKAFIANELPVFNERTGNFMVYARWAEYFLQSPDRSTEAKHGYPFSAKKLGSE